MPAFNPMQHLIAVVLALLPAAALAAIPVEPARVIRTFPHDPQAFTEGLLIRDGWLYESTGYEGQSFIRRKELATGKTLQSIAIPPSLFGEGIVDWGNRLYSFVWHGEKGFVWDLKSLRQVGGWHYTGEGWALTHDARNIILSDGTSTLRFLAPGSMQVVRRLAVTAEGAAVPDLNELEFVHGEILANVWHSDRIARIDPATGKVKGWIDVGPLWRQVGVTDREAVPNGIAFDRRTDRLYVTGKNWPLLFQIKLPTR